MAPYSVSQGRQSGFRPALRYRPLVIVPDLYLILMDLRDLVGHWAHERGKMSSSPQRASEYRPTRPTLNESPISVIAPSLAASDA